MTAPTIVPCHLRLASRGDDVMPSIGACEARPAREDALPYAAPDQLRPLRHLRPLHATQGSRRPDDRRSRARVAASIFTCGLLCAQPAAAADNFIQLYLAAQGGCANSAASPLSFVLAGPNLHAPFGKQLEDWSDDDLAALKLTLAACQAASAGAGNPYTAQEVRQGSDEVLARVPQLVAQARAQAEARAQQLTARQQIANARLDKATQARMQARASGEAEAARLEREADAAEAEAREAQQRLDQRVQHATRARDEARSKAAAVAGVTRRAEDEAGALAGTSKALKVQPAAPGELSELVPDDEAAQARDAASPLTVTAKIDTPACTSVEAVMRHQPSATSLAAGGAVAGTSNECRTITKGTHVTVQAMAAGADARAFCVALAGQPGCFWVAKAAFETAAP